MCFRCLNGERKLRYKPLHASRIINACATLHNFLIDHGLNGEEFDMPNNNNGGAEVAAVVGPNEYYAEGRVNRDWVSDYFEAQMV